MSTTRQPSTAIVPGCVYPLETFKQTVGFQDHSMRKARRAGLKVHYKHGRAFVYADDFIAYIADSPSDKE